MSASWDKNWGKGPGPEIDLRPWVSDGVVPDEVVDYVNGLIAELERLREMLAVKQEAEVVLTRELERLREEMKHGGPRSAQAWDELVAELERLREENKYLAHALQTWRSNVVSDFEIARLRRIEEAAREVVAAGVIGWGIPALRAALEEKP